MQSILSRGTASVGRQYVLGGFSLYFRQRPRDTISFIVAETFSAGSDTSFPRDSSQISSVNPHEADKFARLSNAWWDEMGPFKPLHAMNRVRCEFIKRTLDSYIRRVAEKEMMPTSIRVLDVGCGGGILSESLATMKLCSGTVGLRVTGIDVHDQGIQAAVRHRDEILLTSTNHQTPPPELDYRVQSIEELVEIEDSTYDVVIASEVIEHVDAVQQFCRNIVKATKPGGHIIVSTLNRTVKSYLLAILGAEYVTRMVPKGTHDWNRFITPEELVHLLCEDDPRVSLDMLSGMSYQPLTGLWHLGNDTDINYIASYTKDK